ncbi:PAS/PAC sensor signal transduction histidine kinase [Solidesulfovibrio fructosivorans JJ]]|uniref:histidine kinase n=1 Tax=Solidesulfovibrio fructosivorans JJ] TaxID=596151 RepID=E1JS38_SOLFR|nr:PAS domain-containing protein [Solidesulfovibrio fructosivorans]EFL52807.1 PAS/PAC sensor signal transduction histidine kinase [Solidesulfovibrio fructosivorans JJ]]
MSRSRPQRPQNGPDLRAPYFEALLDALPVGLCFLDTDRKVVAANGALRRFYPGEFVVGRPCPAVGEACRPCLAEQALAAEEPVSRVADVVGPDGATRQVESVCHPLRGPDGRVFGLAEIVRDISRRVSAEREMAMAGQDIEMLLASIRSILVSLDGEDRVRRFNAGAETAFGIAAGEAKGKDFFALPLDWEGQALREAVAASRDRLSPVRVDEVRCRIPGGDERMLGLTVNPVPPAASGSRPGVLLLGQDLAEIKAREFKTLQERRMQAIGCLAAGIAHEINTPVQYVTYNVGFLEESFTDILRVADACRRLAALAAGAGGEIAAVGQELEALLEDAELDYLRQEIPAAIANSRKGLRQVSEIIAAMRQMSHPGTAESLFFDINAAVRDIVTITRNAWKHVAEVELKLADGLPLVYGQPHEVSQVLLNVVINAAQAVEERVGREPWRHGRIAIATSLEPQGVTVAVADNGAGIDPADEGRIFDPFFTSKPAGKGTGQGLAISQAIMSRHGGGIEVANRPGEGVTFFLRFPAENGDGTA